MTLAFPNPSRSFDEVRNAVRFIGHDGMLAVRFFVEADALAKLDIDLRRTGASETKYLKAFDALRASIQDVAREAYSHGRRDSYTLTPLTSGSVFAMAWVHGPALRAADL